MKRSIRLSVEILGPALVGTTLLFAWKWKEFGGPAERGPGIFFVFLAYAYAYAFAITPSLVYAFVMEAWFRLAVPSPLREAGTVGLSTGFGLGAGWFVQLVSEAPLTAIGVLVGLILGAVLAAFLEKRTPSVQSSIKAD